MAAISIIAAREVALRSLVKRENWAHKNPGVIVVFCIVFIVAVALLGLFISKKLAKRKAAKAEVYQ